MSLRLADALVAPEIGTAKTLSLSTLAGLVTLRVALTAAPDEEMNETGIVHVCPANNWKGSFGWGRGMGNAKGSPGVSQVAPTMAKLFSVVDAFARITVTPLSID